MEKQNCWEFRKCGREMGGHSASAGVCPAATAVRLNGTHDGTHGGRSCWVVAHTLCFGSDQGTFAQKYKKCEQCSFYRSVRKEEGMHFVLPPVLLSRLCSPKTFLFPSGAPG